LTRHYTTTLSPPPPLVSFHAAFPARRTHDCHARCRTPAPRRAQGYTFGIALTEHMHAHSRAQGTTVLSLGTREHSRRCHMWSALAMARTRPWRGRSNQHMSVEIELTPQKDLTHRSTYPVLGRTRRVGQGATERHCLAGAAALPCRCLSVNVPVDPGHPSTRGRAGGVCCLLTDTAI
jgi:hypothetical protein